MLSIAHAVELLPFGDSVVRGWLERRDLVVDVPGMGRCVLWGQVLDVLEEHQRRPRMPYDGPPLRRAGLTPHSPKGRRR